MRENLSNKKWNCVSGPEYLSISECRFYLTQKQLGSRTREEEAAQKQILACPGGGGCTEPRQEGGELKEKSKREHVQGEDDERRLEGAS